MAPTAPTPVAEALLDALTSRPGASAADLADAAGIGRSTAGKLLASLAAEGRVVRQPGSRQQGRRTADRWTLPAAAAEAIQEPEAVAAAAPADPAAEGRPPPTRSERLPAGELRGLVLTFLADRPGQALSPTAIAKELGRSAGAVANALTALAGQGAVVQTHPKPRRYTIAATSGQATPTG